MKGPVGKRSMKMLELAARIGSEAFVIFGYNSFVVFLPAPRIEGVGRTVPFFICAFQIVGGFFLTLNRFVGLLLAVRATIIVNIHWCIQTRSMSPSLGITQV